MTKLSNRIASVALGVGLVLAASAAADARPCGAYAHAAVRQHVLNVRFDCGYVGLRWTTLWRGHRNWCRIARPFRVAEEFRIRQNLLRRCGVPERFLPRPALY